ncbi:MAG: permease prefix domain 1-containing protein, partial [Phycisphaerae bacterium]|nr:permease prefix domain 1-containing protein [Phycisphaerae bacterium]
MNGWDQLIARLTQPLEVDQELRLDVARELRCHLEDSAAEFRAAGESPTEAAARAAKALGNEEELTEQLWEANRARIRLRGVLRWTARVTLLPAAVIVVLVLFTYLVGITAYVHALGRGGGWGSGAGWPMGPLGKLVCDPRAGIRLTEDQRWLLDGDPNAKTDLERAKSIADRWPDNPIYYAQYVTHLLHRPGFRSRQENEPDRFDEKMLTETLAALDHGEQWDPDNAFYNLEAASLLVQTSSTLRDDPSAAYDKIDRSGRITPVTVQRIEVADAERFQRGLEEFHRSMGKPHLTSRG